MRASTIFSCHLSLAIAPAMTHCIQIFICTLGLVSALLLHIRPLHIWLLCCLVGWDKRNSGLHLSWHTGSVKAVRETLLGGWVKMVFSLAPVTVEGNQPRLSPNMLQQHMGLFRAESHYESTVAERAAFLELPYLSRSRKFWEMRLVIKPLSQGTFQAIKKIESTKMGRTRQTQFPQVCRLSQFYCP